MSHEISTHIYIECSTHAFSLSVCFSLFQFSSCLRQKHWEITLAYKRIRTFTETLSWNYDLKLTFVRFNHFQMGFIAFLMNSSVNLWWQTYLHYIYQEFGIKKSEISENDESNLLIEVWWCTTLNKGEVIASINATSKVLFLYPNHAENVLMLKEINQPISGYEKMSQNKRYNALQPVPFCLFNLTHRECQVYDILTHIIGSKNN